MNEEITMDRITGMLHEITGFKADASQIDAVRVAMEAYAARLAQSYASAPSELAEAHLNSLASLASQLLDTGGRMRLDPAGQLDVPENPVATKRDIDVLALQVASLVGALEKHGPVKPDLSGVNGRLDTLETRLADVVLGIGAVKGDIVAVTRNLQHELDSHRPDLEPIQAQLDALTKAVVAKTAAQQQDEILSQLSELNQMAHDILTMLPQPEPDESEQAAMMISTGLGISPHEWDQMDADAAAMLRVTAYEDSLRLIGELRQQEEPPKRAPREDKTKTQAQNRPGCFFNDDGSITCRDCGRPKDPSEYYKDARAWTGRKAACKDCERTSKRKTPVF